MNEHFDLNDVVKVEQLPIVFEQLEKIGTYIKEQLQGVEDMPCTEENKQEVKNRRTEITNTLNVLETKRKEIKNKILEPYKAFEEKYESECKHQLEDAKNTLSNKINEIEQTQRAEKEIELREFFDQYKEEYKLDNIVTFEMVGLNITLSASMKSLKDEIIAFCTRVNNDIETIMLDDDKDELFLEYKMSGLDYTKAKATLLNRKKQLEELRTQSALIEEQQKENEIVAERVEELVAPKPIFENEEVLEASFTIKTTKDKILKLKEFMKDNGIEYE